MNRFLLLIVMCVAAGYASAAGMAQAGESEPVYGLGDISTLSMSGRCLIAPVYLDWFLV